MKFQNMLTFLSSNVSFAKKAVSEHQFRENEVTCECCSSKTLGEIHVSSNNLAHVFATVTII